MATLRAQLRLLIRKCPPRSVPTPPPEAWSALRGSSWRRRRRNSRKSNETTLHKAIDSLAANGPIYVDKGPSGLLDL